MKTGRIILMIVLAFIGVILFINKCKDNTKQPGTGSGAGIISVNGIIASSISITDVIHVTGTLIANKEVVIQNETSGKLNKIYFKEGSEVKAGDLLAKIFDEDLKAELKKLEAEEKLLSINESRMKDLLKVQGLSQQEYDESLNVLQRIQADIELKKVQISKTEIRAPFTGIAGLEAVNEGSILSMNTKIVSLQDLDPIKLDFSIPEKYKSRITMKQKVYFTIDTDQEQYEAEVYAMEPKVDPATRTIQVRAMTRNPNNALSPGSFARLKIPLNIIDDALMIPSQALIPELKGYKTFLQKNGKAFPVSVQVGLRNDSTVQVTSGISEGDTVLIDGIMQLRNDMPVHVNIKK